MADFYINVFSSFLSDAWSDSQSINRKTVPISIASELMHREIESLPQSSNGNACSICPSLHPSSSLCVELFV